MPVISLTLGQVTPEARKDLITSLTAAASEVTQIPAHAFVVFIHELAEPCIGVGGKPLDQIKQEL